MKAIGMLVLVLLGSVCLAGFFSGAAAPRAAKEPVARRAATVSAPFEEADARLDAMPMAPPPRPGFLARVDSPNYRRSAELMLKVADCVKAEDELEAKLEKVRGEILEMLMEGTEGSRRCTLRVLLPSPSFRGFVSELRAMGKVQAEKITASKIRTGGAPAGDVDVPDARELCLVAVRLADEKVAAAVVEGRGNLASSFDRSAAHLLDGVSVLVEGLGYVLPFALAAAAVLAPALLLRRFRRARAVAA